MTRSLDDWLLGNEIQETNLYVNYHGYESIFRSLIRSQKAEVLEVLKVLEVGL